MYLGVLFQVYSKCDFSLKWNQTINMYSYFTNLTMCGWQGECQNKRESSASELVLLPKKYGQCK